jgi:hypothetical protein
MDIDPASARGDRSIRAEGATFTEALADLLAEVAKRASGGSAPSDRSIRWQCEAATEAGLVAAAIESIAAVTEDHGATIAGIELDGVRPIETGFRCWGTLATGASDTQAQPIGIADRPRVEHRDGAWHIALTVRLG